MSIKKYYNLAKIRLFPITRSLTGEGAKEVFIRLYPQNIKKN